MYMLSRLHAFSKSEHHNNCCVNIRDTEILHDSYHLSVVFIRVITEPEHYLLSPYYFFGPVEGNVCLHNNRCTHCSWRTLDRSDRYRKVQDIGRPDEHQAGDQSQENKNHYVDARTQDQRGFPADNIFD